MTKGQVLLSACAALVFAGCSGEAREPPRAATAPPAAIESARPVSGQDPPLAEEATPVVASPKDIDDAGAANKAVPQPLPATARLARGAGAPGDLALAAGDAAYDHDDFALAEAKYREAASQAPKDAAPLVGLARVAIAKTNVATDYNAAPHHPVLEKAAADLRQSIKLDPQFAPAYTELGRALLILGKANEALAALRKAVDLSPRDPEAHSGLGVAYLATGRPEDAVVELTQAALLDPGSAPRQTNLGTALLMRGRVAESVRAYEAAARIAPNDARTLSDLGTALLADNQVDKAIQVLRQAIAADSRRAALHSNLGYALQQRRDLPSAIAEYREALRLDDQMVSAWINLATALAQTGDRVEARKALDRAQKIDPTDPRVRANLEELRDLAKKGPAGGGKGEGGK